MLTFCVFASIVLIVIAIGVVRDLHKALSPEPRRPPEPAQKSFGGGPPKAAASVQTGRPASRFSGVDGGRVMGLPEEPRAPQSRKRDKGKEKETESTPRELPSLADTSGLRLRRPQGQTVEPSILPLQQLADTSQQQVEQEPRDVEQPSPDEQNVSESSPEIIVTEAQPVSAEDSKPAESDRQASESEPIVPQDDGNTALQTISESETDTYSDVER